MFFPGNAGYHYRVHKWAEILESEGHSVQIQNIFNEDEFKSLYSRNDLKRFLIKSLRRRFSQVLNSRKYDVVIVRRMLLPYNDYGNLFLDKLLLSIHENAILDYDDDLTNNLYHEKGGSLFGKLLDENRMIFYKSLELYKHFIAGNKYLMDMAINLNKDEVHGAIIPTCVDYTKHSKKSYSNKVDELIFAWIGTNQNQKYLDNVIEDLNVIAEKRKIMLHVVSGKDYKNEKALFPILNIAWSLENEVEELLKTDIGIMPLNDDKIAKGKCGFKLIQYMALGIIPLASAVGVNEEIIEDEVDGFLVYNGKWQEGIDKALSKEKEFAVISQKAITKVEGKYTFESNKEAYLNLIKSCSNSSIP